MAMDVFAPVKKRKRLELYGTNISALLHAYS